MSRLVDVIGSLFLIFCTLLTLTSAEVTHVYALDKCYSVPLSTLTMKYSCTNGTFRQDSFQGSDCAEPLVNRLGGPSPWHMSGIPTTWTCASGVDKCRDAWKAPGAASCVIASRPAILPGESLASEIGKFVTNTFLT
mmetsp:Transcript_128262/g.235213  ORF Transcript_128262/g.235213 Transcript_128262/m.235213 type:complete len:137 (-) Transcript_128262:14-424(-)